MLNAELKKAAEAWPDVSKMLSVPHNRQQYDKAVETLNRLMDEVGENENHPLASLMETLALGIETYEKEHFAEPMANPVKALKFLMQEHGLKQSDLPDVASQGVISDILRGRRLLTLRQIRALSKKFHVSPAVFV